VHAVTLCRPAAGSSGAWVDVIRELVDMTAHWSAELSSRGRETVAAHCSFMTWQETWRFATGLYS
jgi:hypothetical protein